MTDFIVIGIVLIILGAAGTYIVKAKKTGIKCIGCPNGCACMGKCENEAECDGDCFNSLKR